MLDEDHIFDYYEIPEDFEVYPEDLNLVKPTFPYQFYSTPAELRRGRREYFNTQLKRNHKILLKMKKYRKRIRRKYVNS